MIYYRDTCDECGEEDTLCDEYDRRTLCLDCLQKAVLEDNRDKLTLDTALKIGKKNPCRVEINGMLAYWFDDAKINEILEREMREEIRTGKYEEAKMCEDFLDGDYVLLTEVE